VIGAIGGESVVRTGGRVAQRGKHKAARTVDQQVHLMNSLM
jgi:hypothetical protein